MKLLTSLFIAICVSAMSGCNATAPAASQPTGFTFHTVDGTFASFGWTGAVHDVEAAPETPFEVKATDCENDVCGFEGPVDSGAKVNRRRCQFPMSKTCTTDADCPLNQGIATPCVYIYDAPVATPLPGPDNKVGACGWTYIPFTTEDGKPPITGTLNLTTGALKFKSFKVLLPLNGDGMGGFAGACAECVGDVTANDGVKDGTCMLSTHLGTPADNKGRTPIADPSIDIDLHTPCDVNRTGKTGGYNGNYSMDCSPTVTPGLGELQFGGSFSSSGIQLSLSADSPDCGASPGKKCFCGMCTDGKTACLSKGNCGVGESCVGASLPNSPNSLDNVLVAANHCYHGTCNWNEQDGIGTCPESLGGTPEKSGDVIGCYASAEHGATKDDGSAVTIIAPGLAHPDPDISGLYYANTAGARCIPAGSRHDDMPLNAQVGLPGLLFQKRNFQIAVHYAENPR